MATKSDLQKVLKTVNTERVATVYALSDGHIYIDGNTEDIIAKAVSDNLEIFTFKGEEITKPKPKKNDATSGS